jgi:LuxR family maltose regulon positive regulatory protein
MVEAAGAIRSAIGILALQSLVLQAQGENDQAMAALERALSLAEPEGYVRVFAGEGGAMGSLLRQAASRGIRPDYVRTLLAALESGIVDEQRPLLSTPSLAVEPLSERELEILRYLATPMPTTRIAEELVVSASTVRSHVKRIYHKLNVHKRTDAVRRAKGLGLL